MKCLSLTAVLSFALACNGTTAVDQAGEVSSPAQPVEPREAAPAEVPSPPLSGEPSVILPTDEQWLSAENVGGMVEPPRKLSGPALNPLRHVEGQKYYLATCFLGLIIRADGSVERVDFLAPRNASSSTREHFTAQALQWRFAPATRDGQTVRVRYLVSVSDCPYLPAE